MNAASSQMELAPGWSIDRVLDALSSKKRLDLAQFIKERYDKRFFEPIVVLEREATRLMVQPKPTDEPSGLRPYGFAIMSIACQLVETLESYRRGIPTTSGDDLKKIQSDPNFKERPKQIKSDNSKKLTTKDAFKTFFSDHKDEFSALNGEEFFTNIRNSLLHQSQTRNGWIIKIHRPEEALAKRSVVYVGTVLYRDSFVSQLQLCFTKFIKNLEQHCDEDNVWRNPERKLWWIAWLSNPQYIIEWNNQQTNKSGKN